MKALLVSTFSALVLAVPAAVAAEETRPIQVARENGGHPIARILFAPLLPFIEIQAELSPEKASCWNDGASEVVGCRIVTEIEDAQEARPTPYQ